MTSVIPRTKWSPCKIVKAPNALESGLQVHLDRWESSDEIKQKWRIIALLIFMIFFGIVLIFLS